MYTEILQENIIYLFHIFHKIYIPVQNNILNFRNHD